MTLRVLRIAVYLAIAAATVVLALSFVPVIEARNNPSADGLQWVAAFFAVPVYVTLVVPALVLALTGRPLPLKIAAGLLALAIAAILFVFWN